jgi:hypothetical protein
VEDVNALRKWLLYPLVETLAKILMDDGQYLENVRPGQMGTVAIPEPPRHTAGGYLAKVLLGVDGTRDFRTLETLCNAQTLQMAWDKAVIARTLAHGNTLPTVSAELAARVKSKVTELLEDLATHSNVNAALTWANPYDYGIDATNQWATTWALLPFVSGALPAPVSQGRLTNALQDFLLAQAASAAGVTTLLPNGIKPSGEAMGRYVFGTGMSVVCWRTLELSSWSEPDQQSAASQGERTINRLLHNWEDALEIPSLGDPAQPLALEGFLGWAGLLMAAGTAGTRILTAEALKITDLAAEMELFKSQEKQHESTFTSLVTKSHLFMARSVPVLARSLSRIARLQSP